jgi:hypothetical protein
MRDYICPDRIYADVNRRRSSGSKRGGIVLRKAERVRPVNRPTTKPHRELKDGSQETVPALQRTSRFRTHDETDDGGHSYPTARYLTRFD